VVNLRSVALVFGLCVSSALAGCGGHPPRSTDVETTKAAAVADPNDRTHTGRATYQTERAERFREIARRERERAQAFARWTPRRDQTGKVNVNIELKARAEARAAAADQIAAEIQELAAFHTAEAAKEVRP
jgi:hypothetical protein